MKLTWLFLLLSCFSAHASAEMAPAATPVATPAASPSIPADIRASILAQGVPADSLDRILNYLTMNVGQFVNAEAYSCKPDPKSTAVFNPVKPCEDESRTRITTPLLITAPRYVVVIDFSLPSTDKRYMFIDLTTGTVEKFLTAHGKGSGDSKWATHFSNKLNSKMTSLGLYRAGGVYDGKYGATMRLYGLERSNDQAYARDIVAHGAWYAQPDFLTKENPRTKQPYDRLGVSWGCPAIDPSVQKRLLPLLREVGLYDFYHPALMAAAQSGGEVSVPSPDAGAGTGVGGVVARPLPPLAPLPAPVISPIIAR